MDPVSLAIIAGLMQVGPAVGGALAAAGPAAAVVAPAAASVGPAATAAAATAPVWIPATAHAALATGAAGSVGAGAAVATNPVAAQGVEAWANDINNQAVIGSVEANNFIAGHVNPHLPPEHQIPERTVGY